MIEPSIQLPDSYRIISVAEHNSLLETPFKPATDVSESEFEAEISTVRDLLMDYFDGLGVYGSHERYEKRLPSDFWIPEDGFSDSRSIGVDLLNPALQRFEIIEHVRSLTTDMPIPWLVILGHDAMCDEFGESTGDSGEYSFWITKESVLIHTQRSELIQEFLNSLPERSNSGRTK